MQRKHGNDITVTSRGTKRQDEQHARSHRHRDVRQYGAADSLSPAISRAGKRGRGEEHSSVSSTSTSATTLSAELTNGNRHHNQSHRERFGHTQSLQQTSSQHDPSQQDQREREAKKEQRAKRLNAIKEAEKHFIHLTTQYIVGENDGLNLPNESGCGIPLKKTEESFHAYSSRVNTMVYQKVYNRLMHQGQVGSSYSFNKRTSGNPLHSSGLVFMKDLDIDYITKQAISAAFHKLQSPRPHSRHK